MKLAGHLRKMRVSLESPVTYQLPVDERLETLNPYIEQTIRMTHNGDIHCTACGRKTNKSYSQGHCYPCSQSLASCDLCIMKPETCHFDQGTCREPEWGLANCMRPHYLYLANSSGLKVGITRETQIPTRWIDQGAVEALPIAKVQTRLQVGLMEVAVKSHINDKTNWRKMLQNKLEEVDIQAKRDELFAVCKDEIGGLQAKFGSAAVS